MQTEMIVAIVVAVGLPLALVAGAALWVYRVQRPRDWRRSAETAERLGLATIYPSDAHWPVWSGGERQGRRFALLVARVRTGRFEGRTQTALATRVVAALAPAEPLPPSLWRSRGSRRGPASGSLQQEFRSGGDLSLVPAAAHPPLLRFAEARGALWLLPRAEASGFWIPSALWKDTPMVLIHERLGIDMTRPELEAVLDGLEEIARALEPPAT